MSIYARIDSGRVAELFETDGDITTMFNPAIVWVDVTGMDPEPGVGWSYDGQSFDAPAVVTLSELRAALCVSVDAAADTAYIAIGGPSPGRLAEYKQAKADADAFKTAGYTGAVPDTIACWAEAKAWTAQQACDDILTTAASWEMALAVIRRQRLIGKANVNAAADAAAAQAAADAAMAVIQSIPAGAG